MVETLWALSGVAGAAISWAAFISCEDGWFRKCPTPRAIAGCLACFWLGPFMLGIAGCVVLGCLLAWITERPQRATWWTRPICKGRD